MPVRHPAGAARPDGHPHEHAGEKGRGEAMVGGPRWRRSRRAKGRVEFLGAQGTRHHPPEKKPAQKCHQQPASFLDGCLHFRVRVLPPGLYLFKHVRLRRWYRNGNRMKHRLEGECTQKGYASLGQEAKKSRRASAAFMERRGLPDLATAIAWVPSVARRISRP